MKNFLDNKTLFHDMEKVIFNEIKADVELFERENFIFYMNNLFESAPYSKPAENDVYGLRPFIKEGLNNYILGLFPLFQDILHTKIEQDISCCPVPKACNEKSAKFLVAVITRGLRQGGCVERYLIDVPHLPYFINKIVKIKRGRKLLANSNIDSLDFKLALLTSINFMNERHNLLFEMKARNYFEKIQM